MGSKDRPRMNCWEHNLCGRGPRGQVPCCPVALAHALDGINGGINGGRMCWMVSGTMCGGQRQTDYLNKRAGCASCGFFRRVKHEEGERFRLVP